MSKTSIPIAINSPSPVHVLRDNHLTNSDWISIGALGLSFLLILVTLFLVLADRSMVRQSELQMRHDSLLDIYTIFVAGMSAMIALHEWRVKNTTLEMAINPIGLPSYKLVKPNLDHYTEVPNIRQTTESFTSFESMSRLKLLKNDDIASEVDTWLTSYELIITDWDEAIPGFEATLTPSISQTDNPRQRLSDIQRRQLQFVQEKLRPAILDLMEKMQSKLIISKRNFFKKS